MELRMLEHKTIDQHSIRTFRYHLTKIYDYLVTAEVYRTTYDEIIQRYSGKKKRRYELAKERILLEGLDYYADSAVNTFVKVTKYDIAAKTKPGKDHNKLCRTVNTRSYKFTLELLTYIHPIEEELMKMTNNCLPCIAKGKNLEQRCKDIYLIWTETPDPVCLSLDLTGFDMHITKQMLKEEFKLYRKLYGDTKEIRLLTSAMLVNRIRTQHGLRYKIKGQRMSGDATTACGNVIQMITILRAVIGDRFKYNFYDDGDDCLLFISKRDLGEALDILPGGYSKYGHVLKIENIAREFSEIVFCQHRPFVNMSTKIFTMIPDPYKVLSNMTSHYRYYSDHKYGLRMFKTIIFGYFVIYNKIPVIAHYAHKMLTLLDELKIQVLDKVQEDDNDHYYWFKVNDVDFSSYADYVNKFNNNYYDPVIMSEMAHYYDFTKEDVESLIEQIDSMNKNGFGYKWKECQSGYYARVNY